MVSAMNCEIFLELLLFFSIAQGVRTEDPVTNCMEGWVEDLNDSNQIKIELHQLASRENAGYNYLVEICKELCHGEVVKEQDDKEQGEQQTTKYCVAKTDSICNVEWEEEKDGARKIKLNKLSEVFDKATKWCKDICGGSMEEQNGMSLTNTESKTEDTKYCVRENVADTNSA